MIGLENKVAIVTGGAASVGKVITEAFLKAGTRVVIAARSEDKGQALAALLGPNALFQRTDIKNDEDLQRLVRTAVEAFGRLDFVVNNACSFADHGGASTRKEWLDSLDVNVVSAARLVETALPEISKHKGAIVNISSVSAYVAQAGRWVYPVAKAAMSHLTRVQAMDLARHGIRVNSVIPGWTQSDMTQQLSGGNPERMDRLAAEFHLLGRLGRGIEVASAVLFLCSDYASFTTGNELRVEGGYLVMGPEQAGLIAERFGAHLAAGPGG